MKKIDNAYYRQRARERRQKEQARLRLIEEVKAAVTNDAGESYKVTQRADIVMGVDWGAPGGSRSVTILVDRKNGRFVNVTNLYAITAAGQRRLADLPNGAELEWFDSVDAAVSKLFPALMPPEQLKLAELGVKLQMLGYYARKKGKAIVIDGGPPEAMKRVRKSSS